MLKLEQIKEKLKKHPNLSEVARGSGLSPQQVWKVCHHDCNPLYATIEKLSDYFNKTEGTL